MSSFKTVKCRTEDYKIKVFLKILKKLQCETAVIILLLHVCLLLKHVIGTASDKKLLSNDNLCFNETQMQLTQSHTVDLNLVFNGFNIYFNNNQNKFISLVYGLHDTIVVIEKEDFPGISIFELKKMVYSEEPLNLMILYKKDSQTLTKLCEYSLYFFEAK